MSPEKPWVLAGGVAVISAVRQRRAPIFETALAAGALVLLASLTGGTALAPIVRALGILALVGVTIGAFRERTKS